jgi:hypothetical protein
MADPRYRDGIAELKHFLAEGRKRLRELEMADGGQIFQVVRKATVAQETAELAQETGEEARGTANDAGLVATQAIALTEALGQSAAEQALQLQKAKDDLTTAQTQITAANGQLQSAFGQIGDLGTKVGQAQSTADSASSRADAALISASDAADDAAAANALAVASGSAARDAASVAAAAQKAADVAAAKATAAAANVNNMLSNPGAEFDFDGWDSTAKGTIVVQNARVRNGTKAWRVTTGGELRQGQFPVRQGESYRFRMWSWTTNAGGGSLNGGLRLQAYNANATTPTWTDVASTGQGATTTWTLQEVTYVVPANTTHLRARVAWANAAGATVDFDDIELANITDVVTAKTAADNAQATADAAKTTADIAKSTADTAKANAAAAQSTADSASAAASTAQKAADNAKTAADAAQTTASNASNAALNAAGLAADKGKLIVQVSAPTGSNADPENLWFDISLDSSGKPKNQPNRYNTTTSKWEPISDQKVVDAATAAANAQSAAATAATAAATAQSTADSAKTAASAAQQTADTAKANAATAQTAANNAQSTADTANAAAGTAQTKANQASADAAAAAGIAAGKADTLIQPTAPATAMQKSTTLWIDTTNGANTPKRWSGTAWVAVTDKAATDAATAAANAATAAATAKTTADNAASAASTAQTAANTAQAAATAAAVTANGKPQLLFGTSTPSGTAPQGSTWFQVDSVGNIIGQWQQTAASNTGSTWTARQMTDSVIAGLTVGKLQAGTAAIVDAVVQKIAAQTATIQTANIANLFVTSGATLSSAVIEALYAQVVKAHKITADMIEAGTIKAISIDASTFTVDTFRPTSMLLTTDRTGNGLVNARATTGLMADQFTFTKAMRDTSKSAGYDVTRQHRAGMNIDEVYSGSFSLYAIPYVSGSNDPGYFVDIGADDGELGVPGGAQRWGLRSTRGVWAGSMRVAGVASVDLVSLLTGSGKGIGYSSTRNDPAPALIIDVSSGPPKINTFGGPVSAGLVTATDVQVGGKSILPSDTGWITISPINGWRNQTGFQLQYRVWDRVVYLRGYLNNAGATATVFANLPSNLTPNQTVRLSCSNGTSSDAVWMDIPIGSDGSLAANTAKKPNFSVSWPLDQ